MSRVFIKTSHFAEEITYTAYGKAGATINANVLDRGTAEKETNGRIERIRLADVWVLGTDVPTPHRQDTFTFQGATWGIDELDVLKTDGSYKGFRVWTKDPVLLGPNNYRR